MSEWTKGGQGKVPPVPLETPSSSAVQLCPVKGWDATPEVKRLTPFLTFFPFQESLSSAALTLQEAKANQVLSVHSGTGSLSQATTARAGLRKGRRTMMKLMNHIR